MHATPIRAALPETRLLRSAPSGFTLIELMVVVALASIVVTLVAPSFRRLIEEQRLKSVHQQLVTDIQFARSEAVRRGVPVHIRVQPLLGGLPACYIVFSDLSRVSPFSTACDCTLAAGSRCSDTANTNEVKTVQLDLSSGIALSVGATTRLPFDPYSGSMLVPRVDRASSLPARLQVESSIDATRSIRTIVEYSGRPTTCIPAGSTIHSFGVPAC